MRKMMSQCDIRTRRVCGTQIGDRLRAPGFRASGLPGFRASGQEYTGIVPTRGYPLRKGHPSERLERIVTSMTNDRVKTVVEDLERTLLDFVRKHRITHSEYRAATELIIAEVRAGEESLLFDVFLEAETTDVGNVGRDGSAEAIEGPFYLPGAPALAGPPYVLPHRPDEAGDTLIFNGRVTATDGSPLPGAEIDIWHADADGLYSQIHPNIPDWNLRGRLRTDGDGRFQVRTIVPPPYEIPKDGPTGIVLNKLGRHFFRPAHVHMKLRREGYAELTSQLYFEGDQYLDSDVASAVREGLVVTPRRNDNAGDAARLGVKAGFYEVGYDFVLAPGEAAAGGSAGGAPAGEGSVGGTSARGGSVPGTSAPGTSAPGGSAPGAN
jgi:catechol 1,2-dioxygenase